MRAVAMWLPNNSLVENVRRSVAAGANRRLRLDLDEQLRTGHESEVNAKLSSRIVTRGWLWTKILQAVATRVPVATTLRTSEPAQVRMTVGLVFSMHAQMHPPFQERPLPRRTARGPHLLPYTSTNQTSRLTQPFPSYTPTM
jgi:hypothetical protein